MRRPVGVPCRGAALLTRGRLVVDEEVGEVLAAQMAEQIGIEDQMFKLHFVDGEGDSVLVSTHTEIDDLLNCASITARLEPAVEQ